jgi:cyclophilin family peptidyl-prolyl cis-trans isomerase
MKAKILFIIPICILVLTGCTLSNPPNKVSVNFQSTLDEAQKVVEQNNKQVQEINQIIENKMSIATTTKEENLAAIYKGAILKTSQGDIEVAFYGDKSPNTVNNFIKLAKKGFYDGTKFHRVIPDFMIQGGDPNSKDDDWSNDGTGGPGYQFADEFNNEKLVRGSLAMANSGPDTNGSQFFIVTAPATSWLDGKHTNFGKVVKGMDVVVKIESLPRNEKDHPTVDAAVKSIELVKK